MQRISVVLPVYNNADCLPELYRRLVAALSTTGAEFELVFVEDGGRDDSWEVLEKLARTDARVKALRLSRNFGQHPATAAGLEHARGDVIVLMDADLQDRPEDIPLLVETLAEGDVEVVYTVKLGETEPRLTHLTSRLYHFIFSKLARARVPINIGTFRAFTRDVHQALLTYPEKNVVYGPLMFAIGFRYKTVAVQHAPRAHGRSGYSFFKRLALALNSLISYSDLPHKITLYGGFSALFASILYAAIVIIQYLIVGRVLPPGMTVLILLQTAFFGITMLSLGVMGIYLFRVYQEVLNRPRYIVARKMNVADRRESTWSLTG
jgi:polyisoprenyl-phosphate glycosyltransferase